MTHEIRVPVAPWHSNSGPDPAVAFLPLVSSQHKAPRVTIMNEDAFNMSVRKFLKQVGITGQREIEAAVRQSIANGNLAGNEKLRATAIITVGKTNLNVTVEDEIRLE